MSKLLGHYIITVEAIDRLQREFPHDSVVQSMHNDTDAFSRENGRRVIDQHSELALQVGGIWKEKAGRQTRDPAWGSVMRDIRDTFNGKKGWLSGGHLEDFAQKHHFMRRFDGQSPYDAYLEGVEWMRTASNQAILELRAAVADDERHLPGIFGRPARGPFRRFAAQPDYFHGTVSDSIGNAIHCLQDTFSNAHVVRKHREGGPAAGEIVHVKVYRGHEEEGHSHDDKEWTTASGKGFSPTGELAVQATKDLLTAIISSAIGGKREMPPNLWHTFREQWLVAGEDLLLNRHWNYAIDFIERFESGFTIPLKAMEITTFKSWAMDEEAMADALIKECSTNLERVYQVIKKLNDMHYTDADDVSVLYVERLQSQANQHIVKEMKKPMHQKLVDLMIEVLDDGPTFSDEEAAIDFLKTLKSQK